VGGLRDGIQSAVVTSYDTETGEPNYQDTIDLTIAWLLINVTTSANFNYTEMWDDTGDGNVHISLTQLEHPMALGLKPKTITSQSIPVCV
jgi:hypothetical protein